MRREERVTVQGPMKEQQPDGMSHRGGGESVAVAPPPPPHTHACLSTGFLRRLSANLLFELRVLHNNGPRLRISPFRLRLRVLWYQGAPAVSKSDEAADPVAPAPETAGDPAQASPEVVSDDWETSPFWALLRAAAVQLTDEELNRIPLETVGLCASRFSDRGGGGGGVTGSS